MIQVTGNRQGRMALLHRCIMCISWTRAWRWYSTTSTATLEGGSPGSRITHSSSGGRYLARVRGNIKDITVNYLLRVCILTPNARKFARDDRVHFAKQMPSLELQRDGPETEGEKENKADRVLVHDFMKKEVQQSRINNSNEESGLYTSCHLRKENLGVTARSATSAT